MSHDFPNGINAKVNVIVLLAMPITAALPVHPTSTTTSKYKTNGFGDNGMANSTKFAFILFILLFYEYF